MEGCEKNPSYGELRDRSKRSVPPKLSHLKTCPLRVVHLSRRKWPGGLVNLLSSHFESCLKPELYTQTQTLERYRPCRAKPGDWFTGVPRS